MLLVGDTENEEEEEDDNDDIRGSYFPSALAAVVVRTASLLVDVLLSLTDLVALTRDRLGLFLVDPCPPDWSWS